jgi:hypothetical protein
VGTGRRLRNSRVALSATGFNSLALRLVLDLKFERQLPICYPRCSFSGGVRYPGYP